jgi:hypothetical protein
MRYSDATGFGWLDEGKREAVGIPLAPYAEMKAVAKDPQNLPHVRRRVLRRGHAPLFRSIFIQRTKLFCTGASKSLFGAS